MLEPGLVWTLATTLWRCRVTGRDWRSVSRTYLWSRPVADALRSLGELRGRRVLEIGGCTGHMTSLFAMLGAEVTMLDMVDTSQAEAECEKWGVTDRVRLLRTDGGFDVIAGEQFDVAFTKTSSGASNIWRNSSSRSSGTFATRPRLPLSKTTADRRFSFGFDATSSAVAGFPMRTSTTASSPSIWTSSAASSTRFVFAGTAISCMKSTGCIVWGNGR